jgi:hypothetical protein
MLVWGPQGPFMGIQKARKLAKYAKKWVKSGYFLLKPLKIKCFEPQMA